MTIFAILLPHPQPPLVEAIQSESAFFGDDIGVLQKKYEKEIAAEADATPNRW